VRQRRRKEQSAWVPQARVRRAKAIPENGGFSVRVGSTVRQLGAVIASSDLRRSYACAGLADGRLARIAWGEDVATTRILACRRAQEKPSEVVTAAILVIGDETCPGAPRDKNNRLHREYRTNLGSTCASARGADVEEESVAALKALRGGGVTLHLVHNRRHLGRPTTTFNADSAPRRSGVPIDVDPRRGRPHAGALCHAGTQMNGGRGCAWRASRPARPR